MMSSSIYIYVRVKNQLEGLGGDRKGTVAAVSRALQNMSNWIVDVLDKQYTARLEQSIRPRPET